MDWSQTGQEKRIERMSPVRCVDLGPSCGGPRGGARSYSTTTSDTSKGGNFPIRSEEARSSIRVGGWQASCLTWRCGKIGETPASDLPRLTRTRRIPSQALQAGCPAKRLGHGLRLSLKRGVLRTVLRPAAVLKIPGRRQCRWRIWRPWPSSVFEIAPCPPGPVPPPFDRHLACRCCPEKQKTGLADLRLVQTTNARRSDPWYGLGTHPEGPTAVNGRRLSLGGMHARGRLRRQGQSEGLRHARWDDCSAAKSAG